MITVSSLSAYLYCKRKLYLQKILGYKEPPKEVLIKGSIRHELHDKINKADQDIVTSIKEECSLQDIQTAYMRTYSALLKNIILANKSELNALNLSLFDAYKNLWPVALEEIETRSSSIFNFVQTYHLFGKEL